MPQNAAQARAPETASQRPLPGFRVSRRPDMRLTSPSSPSCVFADPRRPVPRVLGPVSEDVETSREILGTGGQGIRGRRERLPRFRLKVRSWFGLVMASGCIRVAGVIPLAQNGVHLSQSLGHGRLVRFLLTICNTAPRYKVSRFRLYPVGRVILRIVTHSPCPNGSQRATRPRVRPAVRRPRRCWVGPDVGSDHLPLIADLVWTGPPPEK